MISLPAFTVTCGEGVGMAACVCAAMLDVLDAFSLQ